MAEVAIAIPTFRRPQSLARLLAALEKLETRARLRVIVADNDADAHAGYDLCQSLGARYRWPLDSVIVAERGIAQARNALVERALSHGVDFIAMLDDDEWPEAHWLDALLAVQAETGAEAVQGAVLFHFDKPPPRWAGQFDGLAPIRGTTGLVDMLTGAGNLLLARAALSRLAAPWFDPAFALTGGEDRDFFERLKRAGARFAWADAAIATSSVPAERLRLSWCLRRAYGIGNSDMRAFLKHEARLLPRLCETARILGALLLSPLLFAMLAAGPNRGMGALRRLFRAAGKATALFGRHYNAYSGTHGG